jgi:hypothetical protein
MSNTERFVRRRAGTPSLESIAGGSPANMRRPLDSRLQTADSRLQTYFPHSPLLCETITLNLLWYSVEVTNEQTIPR